MSTRSKSRSSRDIPAPDDADSRRKRPPKAAISTGAEPTQRGEASKPPPGLYLVATPIGNLGDITLRALQVLAGVDVIACEDSRVTRKLLQAHGIDRPLVSYHEHNATKARPALIRRLECGEAVALISDAGTPLISDPGYKLVREAAAAGFDVIALPGPSAALAALTVSALPSDRFFFAGFPPAKTQARRRNFEELAGLKASLIFYESPRRLAACLQDLAAVLGDRQAAVARELTKLHEEVRRGSLETLARHYGEAGAPKGEVVLVVAPPAQPAAPSDAEVEAALCRALADMSLRDASAQVAAAYGLPRRTVYKRALALSRGSADGHGAGASGDGEDAE